MVAAGRFAPGHLGELTQQVPFELVDAVLAQTGRTQSRVRDLPARVVVYLLLAGCLFAELGEVGVWQRLCAGLDGLQLATPTASALTQARRRLGPAPLRALFDLLCGPAPVAATPGVRVGGLLVCAIDATTLSVADTPANLGVFTTHACHNGGSGYPLLRLVALVACGTRSLIAVAFGPTGSGETTRCERLLGSLHAGMLVLLDRNLTTTALTRRIAATDAHLLGRCKANRTLPLLGRLPDGSWRSLLGGVTVGVVDAEITITTSAGRATGSYRLATTLTDPTPGQPPRWWPCTTSAGRSRPPTWS
jgi:Insertion element 4 transposase N-terminal